MTIDHKRLVGTIGGAADRRHDLSMSCTACPHYHLHRFEELAARHGRGCTIATWSAGYVCDGCQRVGTSKVQVSVRATEGLSPFVSAS